MLIKRIGFLLAVGSLLGCATLSKEDCLNADWEKIGYEDGSQGKEPESFLEHRKACAAHGVAANVEAYQKSWAQALLDEYCTEERGFTLGRTGKSYKDVCPAEFETVFLTGYNRGRRLFKAAEGHEQSMRSGDTGTGYH